MLYDQFIGLPLEALAFLKEYKISDIRNEESILGGSEEIGTFGDNYSMYRYQLEDGRYAYEFVQTALSTDVYHYFLGLRVGDRVFTWTQLALNDYRSTVINLPTF